MAKCDSCGRQLGMFEKHFKYKKDEKTYCTECARETLIRDQQEEINEPHICTFQKPRFYKNKFMGYHCQLTATAASFADEISIDYQTESEKCDSSMCPMYQTWQLMKSRGESLKML
jgi:hypothetical protein